MEVGEGDFTSRLVESYYSNFVLLKSRIAFIEYDL